MPKPNARSVTDLECTCRIVQELIAKKAGPFRYDADLNEYHLISGDGRQQFCLYHCFLCGGVLSVSKRHEKFHVVEHEEMKRLRQLCEGVTTINEALARLGPPDADYPHGAGVGEIEPETGRPRMLYFRSIRYCHLSTTAEVGFTDTKNGAVFLSITGKEIA